METTAPADEAAALVDTNFHVVAPPRERSRYPVAPIPGTEDEFTEEQSASIADIVRIMDGADVQQAVVVASRFHGFDNTYCMDSVDGCAQRVVAAANIDAFAPDVEEQVAHWIARGAQGLRFWGGGRGTATWIDQPELFHVWELVRALGVPMNAHTTRPVAFASTRRFLERFADIPLVINNLGHVPVVGEGSASAEARALLELSEYPRVHVNFPTELAVQVHAGHRGARDVLDALCESFGPSRLCWSAFFPSDQRRPYRASVRILRRVLANVLSPAEQAWILGGTARELYPALRSGIEQDGGSGA